VIYWTLLKQFWYVGIILILGLLVAYYHGEYVQAEQNLAVFVRTTEAVGKQAAANNRRREDEWKKKATNAWISRDDARRRLRDAEDSSRSRPPLTPRLAAGAAEICFEPTVFAGAIERFRAGVRGLVREGDAAQIDAASLLEAWPR